MKGLWKNSATRRSQVSASLMDKPKVCSYCGTVGHNRRGCPKLHPQKQHTEKVRVSVCVRAHAHVMFQVLGFMQHVHRTVSKTFYLLVSQLNLYTCQALYSMCSTVLTISVVCGSTHSGH